MNIKALRTLAVTALCAAALSATANADIIAAWDAQNTPAVAINPTPPPWDWHDNVTVSNLALHGNIVGAASGSPFVYTGAPSAINSTDYISFTVTPHAGFEMTLVNLDYSQFSTGATSYSWGYRIGDGAWNSFTGEIALTGTSARRNFTFSQPIVTTEAIEFGFFVSAATTTTQFRLAGSNVTVNEIQLNGTTSAVPEPSTYALMIAGGLVAFVVARRRKVAANN